MANVLPMAKRVEVIAHLVEGAGIRPTSRITGVSKPAILSLLARVGQGCERLHDRLVRDLDIRSIQCDELWSFIQKKQARLTEDEPEHGDAYTFIALAKASKLVIAYRTGRRDEENTDAFIADLRARLLTVPQLFTDGFQAYPMAIPPVHEVVQRLLQEAREPPRRRELAHGLLQLLPHSRDNQGHACDGGGAD